MKNVSKKNTKKHGIFITSNSVTPPLTHRHSEALRTHAEVRQSLLAHLLPHTASATRTQVYFCIWLECFSKREE